ncbi:hypothetical protein [Deinococcus sp.]|uniref:hypothetical protein n=1 Tax=Deinococcus sp. TaxID=47478 RepID=UPI003CC59614
MKLLKLALLLCLNLGAGLAHDSQSAGNVQVTLFTDADDGLRVNTATRISLRFVHAGQPLARCRCRILLYRGSPSARVAPLRDLYLDALQAGQGQALLQGLPAGAYTLVLDGRPVQYGEFDAFRMRYILSATP